MSPQMLKPYFNSSLATTISSTQLWSRKEAVQIIRDMSLSKLWEIVPVSEAWFVVVHGVAKSQTRLSD